MAVITIMPSARSIDAEPGSTLYEALIAAGIPADAPCGGRGICGLCRVRAYGGLEPADEREALTLGVAMLAKGWRLSCRARVSGDCQVHMDLADELPVSGAVPPAVAPSDSGEYGIAVDLGTTSIVAQLVRLDDGERRGTASALNPQYAHGADVLSRISYAAVEGGLDKLTAEAVEGVSIVAMRLVESAGLSAERVRRVTVVGNPTMLHLFAGADPAGLGVAPYTPEFLGARTLDEGSLPALPRARVTMLPGASAFVGADAVAAAVASGVTDPGAGPSLMVDLGTNGELVLAAGDGTLYAASAAAGPAFEAVGATWGMRAVDGAIDRVDAADGELAVHSIGSAQPAGVCGSGLLDAVAAARELGVADGTGLLLEGLAVPGGQRVRSTEDGLVLVLVSVPASDSVPGHDIVVSQLDIRAVQLAKGAVATAVAFLAERGGADISAEVPVAVAGAFGSGLRAETAVALGMLPEAWVPRMRSVGNAALDGAARALTDEAFAARLSEVAAAIEPIELAAEPDFERAFLASLGLEPWRG